MKEKEIKTYGEAADFLNHCDEDDIPIYTESLCKKHKLPINNFLLFVDFTNHDPTEYFPLIVWEDEDGGFMIN